MAATDRTRVNVWSVGTVLLLALFGWLWASATIGSTDLPMSYVADSTADWLVTKAAVEGLDPYDDLRDLAEQLGETYLIARSDLLGEPPLVHPRTPGALLLQTPLLLTDPSSAHRVMVALIVVSLLYVLHAARTFAGVSERWMAVAAPLIGLSGLAGIALAFGAQSALIAALIAAAWMGLRERDGAVAGVLIRLAVTLKLFPVLLVIPLFYGRRRRAIGWMLATATSLHVVGSVLFRISPMEVVHGLSETSRAWLAFDANASLAGLFSSLGMRHSYAGALSWVLATVVTWLLVRRSSDFNATYALTLTLAVLGSPLSWEHYDVVFLVVIGWLWGQSLTNRQIAGVGVWLGLAVFGRFIRFGSAEARLQLVRVVALTGRAVLLGVILSVLLTPDRAHARLQRGTSEQSRTAP